MKTRRSPSAFPGGSGRWGVRKSNFREHGLPHELLVLTDLSRTLREEERSSLAATRQGARPRDE